ncbi:hypothetical protein [Paenibacillus cisolokensis]|nr:hypothetical protein [Paenibacillus cisolokensis]
MQELDISFGKHRADTNWKPEYLTWDEFVERLRKVRRTAETMAQYDAMTPAGKGKVKDGPAFVGGLVRGGRRKKENVDTRSLFTLDADFADGDFLFTVELVLGGTAYAVYSTHSHRPHKPKYRLIVPADRTMSPDEYTAAARKLAEKIGMTYFDKTTFQVHRLMYFPSCSKDAEPVLEVYEGEPLSADGLLAEYEDWRDVTAWPRHPEETKAVETAGKKAQDPREKQGTIGLFCRAFTIEEGIDTFCRTSTSPVRWLTGTRTLAARRRTGWRFTRIRTFATRTRTAIRSPTAGLITCLILSGFINSAIWMTKSRNTRRTPRSRVISQWNVGRRIGRR